MLDLLDFQPDKGGDLSKLRESQRKRFAPEAIVEDVVALFEDHKKSLTAIFSTPLQANHLQQNTLQLK